MHFHLVNAVICLNIIFIAESVRNNKLNTFKSIWFDLFIWIYLVLFIDNTYSFLEGK